MIDYFTIIGFIFIENSHKCKKNLTLSLMMLCYKCKILLTFRGEIYVYILLFISVLILVSFGQLLQISISQAKR